MKHKMLFVGMVTDECSDAVKVSFQDTLKQTHKFWIPKSAISRQSKTRRGKKA